MPKITCTSCGGKGYYEATGTRPCTGGCGGTGRNMQSALMSQPCSKCHGGGTESYIVRRTCSRCSGTGYTNH